MKVLTCSQLIDSVCQNPSLIEFSDFSNSVDNVLVAMPVFVGFLVIAMIFRKAQQIII